MAWPGVHRRRGGRDDDVVRGVGLVGRPGHDSRNTDWNISGVDGDGPGGSHRLEDEARSRAAGGCRRSSALDRSRPCRRGRGWWSRRCRVRRASRPTLPPSPPVPSPVACRPRRYRCGLSWTTGPRHWRRRRRFGEASGNGAGDRVLVCRACRSAGPWLADALAMSDPVVPALPCGLLCQRRLCFLIESYRCDSDYVGVMNDLAQKRLFRSARCGTRCSRRSDSDASG